MEEEEYTRESNYCFVTELKKAHTAEGEKSWTIQYVPFIINLVRKRYVKHCGYHSFEDLLVVALEASVKAEQKYDNTKSDFSTFVRYYIDGAINEYVIPVSKNQIKVHNKITKFINESLKETGVHPSLPTILKGVGITKLRYDNLMKDLEPVSKIGIKEESDTESTGTVLIDTSESTEGSMIIHDVLSIIEGMCEDDKYLLKEVLLKEVPIQVVANKLNVTKSKAQSLYDHARDRLKDVLELHDITLDSL